MKKTAAIIGAGLLIMVSGHAMARRYPLPTTLSRPKRRWVDEPR